MKSSIKTILKFSVVQLSIILLLLACRNEQLYHSSRIQLGTIINLSIITESGNGFSRISEGAFSTIREIEERMSPYMESSDIYRVNHFAWKNPVRISDETLSMIDKSIRISSETEGCFDITFASLSHLWNFKKKPFVPPRQRGIDRYIEYVNFKNIKIDHRKKTIRLLKRKTKIDLGGIAKGYAIKMGIEYLRRNGVKAAIVEAGGDLQVLGDKFGQHWRAGLIHPRRRNIIMAIIMYDMDSIASSGDYERYAIYKNKRYHHIIDPRTGHPTETLSSVSVISKDPVLSDAYATALFVMGKEKAIEFLRKRDNISGILIDLKMKIYASRELRDRIKPLEEIYIHWF